MTDDQKNALVIAQRDLAIHGVKKFDRWECGCGCMSWLTYGVGRAPNGSDALYVAGIVRDMAESAAILDGEDLACFLRHLEDRGLGEGAMLEVLAHLHRLTPNSQIFVA
jgi:hypothetical protein